MNAVRSKIIRGIHNLLYKILANIFLVFLVACGPQSEYTYNLHEPLNFVMADSLYNALDQERRLFYIKAALHAAKVLDVPVGWARDRGHPISSQLPSVNETIYLVLGNEYIDCTGDRVGYVRWQKNNILQVCPAMLPSRDYLRIVSLMMHEVGHVLGANHVPCDGKSVLAPDLDCPLASYIRSQDDPDNLFGYSEVDLDEICQFTQGGICSKR